MTAKEKALALVLTAIEKKNEINKLEEESNLDFFDTYVGVGEERKKGYASLNGYPELQSGVREPIESTPKDLSKEICHTYKEFLAESPSKSFIAKIIVGSVLLFLFLNILLLFLYFLMIKAFMPIIIALGVIDAIFLVVGLILLLSGVVGSKKYSRIVKANKEEAQRKAEELNKKETDELNKRKKEWELLKEQKHQDYLNKKSKYESLYRDYQTFIANKTQQARDLERDYKKYVEEQLANFSEGDRIPLFVFDDMGYLMFFKEKLSKKETFLNLLIWGIEESRAEKLEEERIREQESWENYLLEKERQKEREKDDFFAMKRIKEQERLRYETEDRLRRESEERERRERERRDHEERRNQRNAANIMCGHCANANNCSRIWSISTPNCASYRPLSK